MLETFVLQAAVLTVFSAEKQQRSAPDALAGENFSLCKLFLLLFFFSSFGLFLGLAVIEGASLRRWSKFSLATTLTFSAAPLSAFRKLGIFFQSILESSIPVSSRSPL